MLIFLKRNWAEGRVQRLGALFAFEFVVVLLGVFTAQLLQEHFDRRLDAERFEATREALNEQTEVAATSLMIRGLQAQCIRSNLERVIEAVERDQQVDLSNETAHPPHPAASMSIWSSEVIRDARRFMSPGSVKLYDDLAGQAADVTELRRQEEEWWAALLLARDGGQGLSDRRKTEVLLAAHKLQHAFQGWEYAITSMAGNLIRTGQDADFEYIERLHSGEGVCREEVRGILPEWREGFAEAKRRHES